MGFTDGNIDFFSNLCYNNKIRDFKSQKYHLGVKKMIERYLSCEENGAEGARRKAWFLNRECKYNILSIEHTMVPQAGSRSTPYAANYMKNELGYRITVDTLPTFFSDFIPQITEA